MPKNYFKIDMEGFKKIFVILLFLCFINSMCAKSKTSPVLKACHKLYKTKINVHLIPHSHDDVGWLKTFSEYYYGTDTLYVLGDEGVKSIISSTVQELKANRDRRFIQVETAYFHKWWLEQNNEIRKDYINLVRNGQIEMVNGGWSMNDEAATNYQSIVDQFTWGFRFINRTLGKYGQPRVGWQIDPFGHSREHASIVKQLGFDGLVLGRIDFRDKQRRIVNKSLEFIWKTSNNLGDSELFTTMFPNFYNYEKGLKNDALLINSKEKVNLLLLVLERYQDYYQTSNIMIPMGDDFAYQTAGINFQDMDNLIEGFKNHKTYNVFYSTPSCYIQAVKEEINKNSIKLEQKTDDFFPYASSIYDYWTGYFTSRPTLKRFERTSNNILQSLKQLAAISRINNKNYDLYTLDLREAMGVLQHHDAITGTAKEVVADDYYRMLYNGIQKGQKAASHIIQDLLRKDADKNTTVNFINFSTCLLANTSICENSQKDNFLVAVQNSLGRSITHYVRLPVDGDGYKIIGPDGEEKNYDIFDTIHPFDYVNTTEKVGTKELVFVARDLPPLGIKLYHIQKVYSAVQYKPFKKITPGEFSFGTERNGFTINTTTGKLNTVTLQGVTIKVTQEFLYYPTRMSGAYLFTPFSQKARPVTNVKFLSTQFAKGNLVDECLQVISAEVTQIIRVYKNDDNPYIEFDWLVGDLRFDEKSGKEVITRFNVENFNNKDIFYTDSNGREQIRRKLNTRGDYNYYGSAAPVTSNYYPVTSKIVIKDETKNLEVAVLNDRSQGGSSLTSGSLELMVHRRLINDDYLGIDEVLTEEQFGRGLYARGKHFLTFGITKNKNGLSSAAFQRHLAQRKLLEPWILVASSQDLTTDQLHESFNFRFQGLKRSLPRNVHILTLEPWTDSYVLRLEHFLEKDEDEELSKPVTVDLNTLFTTFNIVEMRETTLGANEYLRRKPITRNFKVTLNPMQIRTFIFKTDKNNAGEVEVVTSYYSYDDYTSGNRGCSATIVAFLLYLFYFVLHNLQ